MSFFAGIFGRDDDEPKPRPRPPAESQPLGPSRRGLWFGYFGSSDEQVAETADHATMLFAAWGDDQALAARIAKAAMPTILDVSDCLFTSDGKMPRRLLIGAQAGANLQARLNAIKDAGALERVVALYIIDEPARESNVQADDIRQACQLARFAANEFGVSPALHICGGDEENYYWLPFVDWPGLNDYDGDALGRIRRLQEQLQAHQRVVLYPGGADPWRNDPRPFYEFAQANPKVIGICPFLYVDYTGPDGKRQLGIRNNGMAPAYREIGKAIIGAGEV